MTRSDIRPRPPKTAMVVSRFPKVTDTFQLVEMLALEKMGMPIELYPLVHHQEGTVHEAAVPLDRRANYIKLASWEVLKAQLIWLRRNRRAYLDAWKWGIRTNLQAPDFLLRTFWVVPLAAAMSLRMEADGVEHVHAHFATFPTHAAMVIHQLTGLPYSFTGHAHDVQIRRDGLGEKIAQSEFFFCCTHQVADELRDAYGDEIFEKCNVVHHGINLETFTYQEPPADDGNRPFRMICVASFVEKKGHKYLIEACRLLRERGVSFELKLVGGNSVNHGDGQTEVIRLVDEAGLNDVVEFTGKRPQSEIRELLTWADAGVLACCIRPNGDQDGLPNFLTECLAMGRPVVSTRQAGVMELVTDGVEGLLVRTRDARQLADALERLAKNPEMRREMGIAGRKTVEAGHNVDVNTERLFDIYLERAGSRRANAADSTNR